MKNLLLLIAGFILIVLNTLIGLMISKYSPFNYLMVDLSLLISTVLIYLFSNSNISDGYKIGLTVLFAIIALQEIVCRYSRTATISKTTFNRCSGIRIHYVLKRCAYWVPLHEKFAWRHQFAFGTFVFFSTHRPTLKIQRAWQSQRNSRHQ